MFIALGRGTRCGGERGECEGEFLLYSPFLLFLLNLKACEHIIYSKIKECF